MATVNIGLVGAGTVGGGVVKVLDRQLDRFKNELGLDMRLARIADKAAGRFAELPVRGAVCTGDVGDILNDESIQIVVELVGGTGFAYPYAPLAVRHSRQTLDYAAVADMDPLSLLKRVDDVEIAVAVMAVKQVGWDVHIIKIKIFKVKIKVK